MADLSVGVVQRFGRSPIMPAVTLLLINHGGETLHVTESLSRALTPLLALGTSEALGLYANTASVIKGNTGQIAFQAPPDHYSVIGYTARVRVYGSSTVTATQSLGKPTPDGNGVIISDLSVLFSTLSAGSYTVSLLSTSIAGSTDSSESSPFALPLS